MNKQAAADFLGVSVRAVERYTQQAKLSVTYAKGRTRPVAEYRQEELDALRAEINANLYHQRPAHEKPNPANSEQAGGLVAIPPTQALQRAESEQGISMLASVLADALRVQAAPADGTPPVPLRDKLTLSFREAAHLSGVPESHLREGYARGILRGAKIGRGVRVTPDDVRKYVEQRMKGKK
jgi:excisionase family DNA binding protein